jgi:PAS domain S-box-containing protein
MTITIEELIQKNDALQARLDAAEEALRAIQSGEVDALVIYGEDGTEKVFTLEGADSPYRVMVEKIQEGVATLTTDGILLYCNCRMADMLDVPMERLLGATLLPFLKPYDQNIYNGLLRKGAEGASKSELTLRRPDGSAVPVLLTLNAVENKDQRTICLIATDLTEQKRREDILAAERLARSIL